MRITRFIGVFVSIIGIFFTASSYGVITSSAITSYVAAPTTSIGPSGEIELESYQGILPNAGYTPASDALIGKNIRDEGYIIIFGINITSDSGQRLVSAALNMEGTLTIDSAVITDRSGRILDWISGGSGIFQLSAPISNLEDEYDDFFVAIRTTDVHRNYPYDYMNEKMATFGLKSITVSPVDPEGNDVESPSATTAPIRCELIIRDILPEPCDNRPYPLYPQYPVYYQYQPGEMVRPRYDWTPQDYQYAPISEQHSVPQVIPWNTLTPVIAIGCAQRNVTPPTLGYDVNIQNPGEELKSVTLTITDVGIEDFDPSYSLIITLWRDNGDGVWTETDIYLEQFEMSSFTKVDNKREWTVKLEPLTTGSQTKEIIDDMSDGMDDYFIVVELLSSSGYPTLSTIGGDYKIWIQPGGVEFGPISRPQLYAGIEQGDVKTIFNNIYVENMAQNYVDPTDPADVPDLNSNVIPIFALNIAGGPLKLFPFEYIERIRIDLLTTGNMTPSDLAPLRDDSYSGITLWRDNKKLFYEKPGTFDRFDTLIPCKFSKNPSGVFDYQWADDGFDASVGAHRYHTYLAPTGILSDTAYVLEDDSTNNETAINIGHDFFICIRTNNTLSYGSRFAFQIPANEIRLNGAKFALASHAVSSKTITANVYAKINPFVTENATILGGSGPVQVMRVDLEDNNSGKTPIIKGLTVEFYNKGGFTLEDIASFAPLAPIYNPGTNWYTVTNPSADALKECGVVIYQGTKTDIYWDSPVLISRYKYLTSILSDTPLGYQFEFRNSVSIPTSLYVVIRTSASISSGDAFSVGIVGWGGPSDWNTWGSRAFAIIDQNSIPSNIYARKCTEAFNSTLVGSLDLSIVPSFDGLTLNWANRTNVTPNEFVSYKIWRSSDTIYQETQVIAVLPTMDSSYLDKAERNGGGLLDGVTYTYRLEMTYMRQGRTFTIESNIASAKIYGFPYSMTPSKPTAVASTNAIAVWFEDNTLPPYKATNWKIERKPVGKYFFTDVATVDTVKTFYDPYLDTSVDTAIMVDTTYQYRIIALRQVDVPRAETEIDKQYFAESYPSPLSDPVTYYPPSVEGGSSGGGGGCFIATAAFGSPIAKQIDILRQFRDEILLNCQAGKMFVRWYYIHGPKGAKYLNAHPFLRFPVRMLLYPLIAFAWLLFHRFFLYFVIMSGLIIYICRLRIIKQK